VVTSTELEREAGGHSYRRRLGGHLGGGLKTYRDLDKTPKRLVSRPLSVDVDTRSAPSWSDAQATFARSGVARLSSHRSARRSP